MVKYRFTPLNTPKSKKFLHFRKVHARSYKKHIYRFFISPIVQKIFAKKEKLKGCYSPLSGIFIYLKSFFSSSFYKSLGMKLTVIFEYNELVSMFQTMRKDFVLNFFTTAFASIVQYGAQSGISGLYPFRILCSVFVSDLFGIPVNQLKRGFFKSKLITSLYSIMTVSFIPRLLWKLPKKKDFKYIQEVGKDAG